MPSFDTVCEPNLVEVKNAVDTTAKEIATRFDFKGTSAAIELKDKEITLFGDADFQLTQIDEVLLNKMAKRGVDVQKVLKESKLKVQASIQGDAVRVSGAKRDDLQAAMALLRKDITEIPISFNNFRD